MNQALDQAITPPGDRTTLLLDLWQSWATRIDTLDEDLWVAPTRLPGWNVAALCAHVCPDPAQFDLLPTAVVDGAAAVGTAADVLRCFNEPGGVAHTAAQQVADTARDAAVSSTRLSIIERFTETAPAALRRLGDIDFGAAITYPMLGTVAFGALRDVALVEATVHLLDLTAAIGGPRPATAAVSTTSTILIDVCGATAFLDAATGRTQHRLFPIMR